MVLTGQGRVLFVAALSLCIVSVFLYAQATFWQSDDKAASATALPCSAHPAEDEKGQGLASAPREPKPEPEVAIERAASGAELVRKSWAIDDADETMSELAFVVNMCADICPAGFLPLAAGMKETGFLPALAILIVFYGICVYTMYAIGRTAEITGGKDLTALWTSAFGPESSWVPLAVVIAVCLGDAIANSCFVADMLADTLQISRMACLLSFTLFPLLPMCLVKELSCLSHSSCAALVAFLYAAAVMVARALDGSYLSGGKYFASLPADKAPNVPDSHLYVLGPSTLSLLNCLALAFLSHYNGCKYYRELKQRTPARLAKCTAIAMGISALLLTVTTVAGFETFGVNADTVVVLNYADGDAAASVARLAVALSIIASYPLMFSGLREAVIALLKRCDPLNAPGWDAIWKQDAVAMALLAAITSFVLLETDTFAVVGLVGAVCGCAVIYILPCSLYSAAVRKFPKEGTGGTVVWLNGLTGLGCALAVAGAAETIISG